jgi:hypothetical protein
VLRTQGEPRAPGLAHEALAACRTVTDAAALKRRGDGRRREDAISTRKGKSHGVSHIEFQKGSARLAAHIVVGRMISSVVERRPYKPKVAGANPASSAEMQRRRLS